ncbi:MAG TPA: antitoxin Xre/MbcA/ParS toxin-binding domain-containing protein [Gemmataceae bacterium]|nr:antitoxin Xre/MbcA/ParS toxin-binding domain-containing protein [Gemmataceae bacterium]
MMALAEKPRPRPGTDWFRRQRAAQANGFVTILGMDAVPTDRLIARIEAGLSLAALNSFVRNTTFSVTDAADLIGLPSRTLARRKIEKRLHPDESDRLVRAARLFVAVAELFEGDADQARRWMSTPQPALGGEIPARFASTEVGSRAIEELVGRLEHGIPS